MKAVFKTLFSSLLIQFSQPSMAEGIALGNPFTNQSFFFLIVLPIIGSIVLFIGMLFNSKTRGVAVTAAAFLIAIVAICANAGGLGWIFLILSPLLLFVALIVGAVIASRKAEKSDFLIKKMLQSVALFPAAPILLSVLIALHVSRWFIQPAVGGYLEQGLVYAYITIFVVVLFLILFLIFQSKQPKIILLRQQATGNLGATALFLGISMLAWNWWPYRKFASYESSLTISAGLGTAYVVCATVVIWRVLRGNSSSTRSRENRTFESAWASLIVVASAIYLLLPNPYALSLESGWALSLSGAIALALAWVLLRRGARDEVFALPSSSIAVGIACASIVLFCILYPNFKGDKELAQLMLLPAITQAIGIYLCYTGLFRSAIELEPIDSKVVET
jgi:hypothetical protein